MTLFIISLVLLIIGLIVLGYIIFKKIPDLKNLNVESLSEEKQDRAKKDILEAKFSRASGKLKEKINKITLPQKGFLLEKVKKIKDRVIELEENYKGEKKEETTPKSIKDIFEDAKKLINSENFSEAERLLIEVIATDNKNIQAYEMLGDLYFETKSYNQAEEIYKYLLKLSIVGNGKKPIRGQKMDELEADALVSLDVDSKIAVYYEDLGQIYEALDKNEKALDAYLKATTIEPNNPKYLDKLLDMSIEMKDKGLAKSAFNNMKKINPENAKLSDWEKAIEKI